MNLYHLKTFYFTAKYKSLTKAAEFLCITQPAVTKQIKQLQSHYNLKFLDIIGKKVILTDAGLNLYTIAERIFDRIVITKKSCRTTALFLLMTPLLSHFSSSGFSI